MKPTELLMEEHRVIEQVIGCIEKMAAIAATAGTIDAERSRQAIEFIRHFADHCHHAKEEDQLFALMQQRGFSLEQGPLAVMLDEHETGRYHVKNIDAAVDEYVPGDDRAAQKFAAHAHAYAELLKAHIIKEDFILYPMADEVFSDEDQNDLLAAFDQVETDHRDHHEKFLAVAEELGRHYEVIRPTEPNYAGLAGVCPAHASLADDQPIN